MGRRANNEGSIYRRKDGHGRWEAAGYFLTTTGIRRRRRFYGATRQEAHDKLVAAQMQAQQGTPLPDKSWRLGEYLDYWLEEVVRPNRRPATYAGHEKTVRLYLKPGLGKTTLNHLSVPVVQRFLNQQLAVGQSVSNVQKMRAVLSAALTQAQREELVMRHVVRLTELAAAETREAQPWTADEAVRFLRVARDEPLYPAYVLAILNGLRLGEILGLRWCDVDFDRGVLHIRQQLQRVSGIKGLIQAPVKTKASQADLPLVGSAKKELLDHHVRQEAARSTAGAAWGGAGTTQELMFTTSSGLPIEPRNFFRSFQRVCRRYEIRVITVHEVRHTLGTLLDELGVSPRIAQLILRHARVTTTQEIYQHHRLDTLRGALQRVEQLVVRDPSGAGRSTKEVFDGYSSRQNQPSNGLNVEEITSAISGGAAGIRTPGLIHAIFALARDADRFTEVDQVLVVRGRLWKLGVVAVNSSRQASRPP